MNMRSTLTITLGMVIMAFVACKGKKEQEDNGDSKGFFPVISYLQGQVREMDSTLNSIVKFVTVDSSKTDTIYLHRDQFREEAKDFLTLPDISKPEYKDRYTESSHYDETLDRSIVTYIPKDPQKEQIQQEEIMVKSEVSSGIISHVIVNSVTNSKDSLVQKRMLWRSGQSFQIVTIRQLAGEPATTTTVKVSWNEN